MIFIFDLISGVKLGIEFIWEVKLIIIDLAVIRIVIDYEPETVE